MAMLCQRYGTGEALNMQRRVFNNFIIALIWLGIVLKKLPRILQLPHHAQDP